MARRRISEAEQARREAAAAAVISDKLPRELMHGMDVFFSLFQKDSPNRHLGEAWANWDAARARAEKKWFADRGISRQYAVADPRYTEALQDVKPLTVEEWIQWHNEGKFNEYR